ncbi:isoprenylcysteine carboxyl methyltransferase family protein [Jeotgalibacillus marinus]|uniref:Isoprenylcysteine carboxylmethyltransferase family protein n=1 Tax=Jeotgalibacillus marinus TaxID=86667 RepID=A0ABV3Q0Y8_9BACL
MLFLFIIAMVCVQRLIELWIAKRNEKWMLDKGAVEAGSSHYPFMIALHASFFLSLLVEVILFDRAISPSWQSLITLFLLTQAARIWCLLSLGRFWNTKILVLPRAEVVKKGPYKFIRHPNYLIVTMEILLLPLLFQAYFTAIVFSLLNVAMLSVRIPEEEKALMKVTNYNEIFLHAKKDSRI